MVLLTKILEINYLITRLL